VPGDKTLKRDIFNNIWLTATQRYEYQHLTFMAQGIVELLNTEIGGVDVPIPSKIFLQSTAATQYDSEMLDFAQKIVTVKD
ncbi:transglutaminase family protein, partial [Acinetobacter baumannii]